MAMFACTSSPPPTGLTEVSTVSNCVYRSLKLSLPGAIINSLGNTDVDAEKVAHSVKALANALTDAGCGKKIINREMTS